MTELKTFKLDGAVAAVVESPDPNAELLSVLPVDHPLVSEIRDSEINFDELLKTKINTKGTTLQDQKKRLDDQKNLILKLRDGMYTFHIQKFDPSNIMFNRTATISEDQGVFGQCINQQGPNN